jgi:Ser/Thr protein kinase RdoA (MazF antagonist)
MLFLTDAGKLDLGAQSLQATGTGQNRIEHWKIRLMRDRFMAKMVATLAAKHAIDICHGDVFPWNFRRLHRSLVG